jgi:hypothetical protein
LGMVSTAGSLGGFFSPMIAGYLLDVFKNFSAAVVLATRLRAPLPQKEPEVADEFFTPQQISIVQQLLSVMTPAEAILAVRQASMPAEKYAKYRERHQKTVDTLFPTTTPQAKPKKSARGPRSSKPSGQKKKGKRGNNVTTRGDLLFRLEEDLILPFQGNQEIPCPVDVSSCDSGRSTRTHPSPVRFEIPSPPEGQCVNYPECNHWGCFEEGYVGDTWPCYSVEAYLPSRQWPSA